MEIVNVDKWILPAYWKYAGDYHTRINVFYGGAGSGKSFFVGQKILLKALQMKRKVLVIRKVANSIRDSIFALFLELCGQLNGCMKSVNKSDMIILLNNGSQILFKGLDDPEKIKSIQGITDIVIEEATELTVDDFTQLNLRLRSNEKFNQIHLMFNPVSKANWVYKYFFENTVDDCNIVKTTYKDNPHLPKEYIDSLHQLERSNPAYYRIYVLGEFATLDKLIFPDVEVKRFTKDDIQNFMLNFQFWCGLDFGFTNDPSALTWGYADMTTKTLYITGCYAERGLLNDGIAKAIIKLGLQKERIIADSAEPKSIEDIRRFGITRIERARKGNDTLKWSLSYLGTFKIICSDECCEIIEEFENYTWKKDKQTNEYINEPIDTMNHNIDAMRYAIMKLRKRNKGYKPIY